MYLRDALMKHLLHYKENTENVLSISVNLKGIDEYVEITRTDVIYDNCQISELANCRKPFCIEITLHKNLPYLQNVSVEMEREFIEVEQHEYFNYLFPFQDIEEGADKCVEVLSSVFGITEYGQVDIKTEMSERIYSTEKLPKPKPQISPNSEKPQSKGALRLEKKRKETRNFYCGCYSVFAVIFMLLAIKCSYDERHEKMENETQFINTPVYESPQKQQPVYDKERLNRVSHEIQSPSFSREYQEGYEKGYAAGDEDSDDGEYHASYDDRNNYSGKRAEDYEEGYRQGYAASYEYVRE